jgi:hypothetical protein
MYDRFINLIENSAHEDYEVNAVIRKLEKLDLNENRILRENSKILIFLVTKTYQESNLFKLHLNEVKKLQKEVIIILLEKDLHLGYAQSNVTKLNDYKIYDLSDAVENSFDGYFLFEKSPDIKANECFEFIRKKLRENYFVKSF